MQPQDVKTRWASWPWNWTSSAHSTVWELFLQEISYRNAVVERSTIHMKSSELWVKSKFGKYVILQTPVVSFPVMLSWQRKEGPIILVCYSTPYCYRRTVVWRLMIFSLAFRTPCFTDFLFTNPDSESLHWSENATFLRKFESFINSFPHYLGN